MQTSKSLPSLPSLIKVHKYFVMSHLDYGDIMYDQEYNVSFHQKPEYIHCNTALAITGAVTRASK